MSHPSQTEVEAALFPHSDAIINIVMSAWHDWRTSDVCGVWKCKRSRANFVWEQIIVHAQREFGSVGAVRELEARETVNFLVDDKVLFRFKKVNENGLSRNVPTQMALAFHSHEEDLFGFKGVMRVDIGYMLNRLETEVVDIVIVARDRGDIIWSSSLLDVRESVTPLPLPVEAPIPDAGTASRIVRPKAVEQASKPKKRD